MLEVDACSRLRSVPHFLPNSTTELYLPRTEGTIAPGMNFRAMAAIDSEIPDLYVCGWRLRTGLALPEALPWPEPRCGRPDLTFSAGAVPSSLKNPVLDLEVLQIGSRGTALV